MDGPILTDHPIAHALREAVRRREDLMVEIARELVRCDSQTPPSDTRETVEIARKYLAAVPGAVLTTHESVAPVVNLVARLRGRRPGKRLVLSGHLDTYPIGDRAAWTVDPLSGEIREGRLYGRGSGDMKGGVAALIAVLAAFADSAADFAGEIVLALAGDEESMGELGTQWLIDNVPDVCGDASIVADVGSPAIIRLGEKGMIWVDVEAKGASAHGAHVHRGVNAIDRLMEALRSIKSLEAMEPAPAEDVAKAIMSAKPLSEPLGGSGESRILQTVTVNVGEISGGTSANLVPESAHASLDIRIPMGLSVEDVEKALRERVGNAKGIQLTVTRRYAPTWTPASDPIATAALEASTVVLGRDVVFNMRVGGSDARLWRRAGVPTVVAGLTPHNLGAPDEFFEISELLPLAEILALTSGRFLGVC